MVGVAPEDGIRVAATGAAVGFDTVWYRQTAGGHVAGACREESYFLCCSHVMLSTVQQYSVYILQELANTAWAFARATQSFAQLLAVLARAAKRRVGDLNV